MDFKAASSPKSTAFLDTNTATLTGRSEKGLIMSKFKKRERS